MAQQTIDIGAAPNDGTGDPLRDAFDKANDNFTELYGRRSACMVKKTAAETGINASAGGYFPSWDSEAYKDAAGYHDNVTNNNRLTTLAGQTRVRIGCTIYFANVAASSQVSVSIYKNGSNAAYDGRPTFGQTSPSATIQPTMTLASGPIPVTGGTDYFTVALFCSDTSIDVTNASSFWIEAA